MTTEPVNLFEFESMARERLPRPDYDHVAGGGTDEISMRRARTVFDSISLRPRMLVDITRRDLTTTVLGHRIQFPVMLSPAGLHGKAHKDGELGSVRAAGALGALMILSAGSSYKMEEVAKAATGPIWFQQYIYKDRGFTTAFAERAKAAGFSAIALTADASVQAKRERMIRIGTYVNPPSPNYEGIEPERKAFGLTGPSGGAPALVDPGATWKELEWLTSSISLPVVVKGVLTAEDARLCVEYGAKAVMVSNHGGRQLDTTFAPVEALPEVVEAVDGKIEVYMDGGIRRGTDVLKALALGARAVSIGRPIFWGLAVNGEAGAREVLQILRDELDLAMAMCGRPNLASLDRSLLGIGSPLSAVLPGKELAWQPAR